MSGSFGLGRYQVRGVRGVTENGTANSGSTPICNHRPYRHQRRRHDFLGQPSRDSQSCLTGTWGAEFFSLLPQAQDHVLPKSRYNAFTNTGLEALLRSLNRTSLFFCGTATSICVETSLRDAACRDFLVTLVDDCCGDYSEIPHNNTVGSVAHGFGAVTESKYVIEGLRTSAETA
jgi:nicotinamidase-related amidase